MSTDYATGNPRAGDHLSYEEAEAILERMAESGLAERPELAPLALALTRAETGAADDLTAVPAADPHFAPPDWSAGALFALIETVPDALVVADGRGAIVLLNRQAQRLFGYRRRELLGRNIEILLPPRERRRLGRSLAAYFAPAHEGPLPPANEQNLELSGLRKDGREFPVEIGLARLQTAQGVFVTGSIRDISSRRRLEARYRTLVEGIPAVTFMAALDEGNNELYVSPQIEELLGFSQKEWLEDPVLWYEQLHPDDRDRWHTEFAQTCALGEPFRSVYRFIARDGRVVWVQGEAKLIRDAAGRPQFIQGMAFDISERKLAEETLRRSREELEVLVRQRTAELAQSNRELEAEVERRTAAQELLSAALTEKESLLKEIHHRVKNNLQVISSLLNLQSASIKDAQTLQAIRESQNRVKSMALIHETLYKSQDLARIDFGSYIRALASHLFRSYGVQAASVSLHCDIGEAALTLDAAIPCGLIVTELVSNSLKHAFPPGAAGEITVSLQDDGRGQWTLAVRDNGVGLPEHFDLDKAESLGLQLVQALADQLEGRLQFQSAGGTCVELRFVDG